MGRNLIVDVDGCIAQYDFPAILKKYFGVTLTNKDIYAYSLEDCLGTSSAAIEDIFIKECFAPPNFIPGAINTLKYLMARDDEIYILTNRLHFMSETEFEEWAEKYGIPYTAILNGRLPEYAHAQVDDHAVKLMNTQQLTTVKHSILFNAPWNRRCLNVTGQLERAKNWGQVKEIIDEKR